MSLFFSGNVLKQLLIRIIYTVKNIFSQKSFMIESAIYLLLKPYTGMWHKSRGGCSQVGASERILRYRAGQIPHLAVFSLICQLEGINVLCAL